jgi:microcystin-dependent protein
LITAGIGSGTANSTYTPPNLKGQFLYGTPTTSSVNGTGGASTVTLGITNIPAHNHTINDPGHFHSTAATDDGGRNDGTTAQGGQTYQQNGWNTGTSTTGITINNTGSGTAFSIMPPHVTVNYIIKY